MNANVRSVDRDFNKCEWIGLYDLCYLVPLTETFGKLCRLIENSHVNIAVI